MTPTNEAGHGLPELARRAVPFLRDEAANYADDGNNEPLELARAIEATLAGNPNRDAANPGGCECEKCGRIFIGAEWHVLCGICIDHGVTQPDGSGLRNRDNVSASTPDASPQPQVTNPADTASQQAASKSSHINSLGDVSATEQAAISQVVAYLIDGRVERGLAFDKNAADDMAFMNAGTVVPLVPAAALALSRGVPEGWKLVPVEPTREMVEAGVMFGNSPNKASMIYQNMVHASPAAAGAQGEDEIDRAARRMGDSARSLLQDIAQQAAPQPAAADGGVRERARELLAAEFKKADSRDSWDDCAIRAIAEALSSHRQAGDDPSKFRELAEGWTQHGEALHANGFDIRGAAMHKCARELLALVEKGAGNG